MPDADVTVIILNYNTEEYTLSCLQSVFDKSTRCSRSFRVFVVDNGSESFDQHALSRSFPEVEVIISGTNLGYGGGCNLGASCSRSRYLYFLNNDTMFLNDVLAHLGDCLDTRQDVGVCGAQQFDGELKPVRSTRMLPRILGQPRLHLLPDVVSVGCRDAVIEAEALSGSNLFIRSGLFREIGGFDARMFLYHEEDDLAFRVRERGMKLALVAGARLQHYHAKSSPQKSQVLMEDALSLFYYYDKHAGKAIAGIARLRVAADYVMRLFKYAIRAFFGGNTLPLVAVYARLALWASRGFPKDTVVRKRQMGHDRTQAGQEPNEQ